MTRIGYVKPQMFETPSRPSQRPPNNGFPSLKLSSFRLRSTTRHVLPLSPGWEPGTSLGFCPFSAIITGRDDTRLPVSSLPAHRFSQPHSKSFVPHDSWVYSTPQALLGSWPSKFNPETIGYPFRAPCSCVVVSSSWLPSCIQMNIPVFLSTAVFPDLRTL
jgi:hypothetical protein